PASGAGTRATSPNSGNPPRCSTAARGEHAVGAEPGSANERRAGGDACSGLAGVHPDAAEYAAAPVEPSLRERGQSGDLAASKRNAVQRYGRRVIGAGITLGRCTV